MKLLGFLRDCVLTLSLLMIGNVVYIWNFTPFLFPVKLALMIGSAVVYLFLPYQKVNGSHTLTRLSKGLHELRCGIIGSFGETAFLVYCLLSLPAMDGLKTAMLVLNFVLCFLTLAVQILCGILRTAGSAKQIKWYTYAALFLWWWVPVLNLFLFAWICRVGKRELLFEQAKLELDNVRQENEICKTKYPILMVHGIFFRDWQYFNYWGRIPAALQKNGAVVYYGKQQSSRSIADSAQELAEQIQEILRETGAEKVNIIAHSKGGLDSRYAISQLGMAPYVASLTTINTPHHGCGWVDMLLQKIPAPAAGWVAARYEGIFRRLGDSSPDFLDGVRDLTVEYSEKFNRLCPLTSGIVYHCVMSEMCSVRSAPFPLWLGYLCNRMQDRTTRNDGLVPVDSAKLEGVPFTMVPRTKHRGVSHGDMIDLMRENIEDFDVREFYVGLVQQLREQNL